MKTRNAIALMLLISLFSLSGCEKDSSSSETTVSRSTYVGNWSVQETWVKFSYEARIEADSKSSSGVLIYNFAGIGTSYPPATALVSGNTITLDPNQTIGDGLVVNGSGTLSGTTSIKWNYTINDGATLIHVTSTFTKH
jgi:hypothetical protein